MQEVYILNMEKEIYISVDENETRAAVLSDGLMEDLFIERQNEGRIAGSIYKGVVKKVLPGMEAAFVDIGLERDGFLYVSEIIDDIDEEIENKDFKPGTIQSKLRKGQEILVQVLREPIGTKGARLTSYISLPGRYTVMMPTVSHLGISRKIKSDKERRRLKGIIKNIAPAGKGFVVRTAGEDKEERAFVSDVRYQGRLWAKIQRLSSKAKAPKLINEELDILHRIVRDMLTDDFKKIMIDEKKSWGKFRRFVKALAPEFLPKVRLFSRHEPMFEHFGIETQIQEALSRVVSLKSGGYVVIEQTEALVSIDVNTGRYTGKRNLEDTVFKTNMEAALEIARQLRLRDMGGIIIIDFIDMGLGGNQRKVVKALEDAVKNDRSRTTILQINELGLVEMTRQRTRRSLSRTLFEICPYCKNSGYIKSVLTMRIEVIRKIRDLCFNSKERSLTAHVNPKVAEALMKEDIGTIKRLRRRFRKNIIIEPDPELKQHETRYS
jgi:ribonuclease G